MFTSAPSAQPLIGEVDSWASVGAGLGYQWRKRAAFVLRTEVQYQRVLGRGVLLSEDNANEFSFAVDLGTRFGNNTKSTANTGLGTW